MATPGISFELTDEIRRYAVSYVQESGLYKNRLANFLGISRPTLDRVLSENTDFFTELKRADANFCKSLVDIVSKKNPVFLLRTKYRDEFGEKDNYGFDPDVEFHRIKTIIQDLSDEKIEND